MLSFVNQLEKTMTMLVEISIMTQKAGHRSVTFDATTEDGGEELEKEVAALIAQGHTVLVTLPGETQAFPVVAYDASNKAWITRGERKSHAVIPNTKVTAIQSLQGG